MIEPTDLIGVELGRYSVCASILDSTGTQLLGYADNSILSAEDTYGGDSRFSNPGPALAALWHKLKLDEVSNLRVAVTMGVGHSGIGSGPAIEQWVDSLAVKIGDPITKAGDPNTGVSYVPTRHLGTVLGTFQSLGVVPERIELPPVAVVRVIQSAEDYSLSVSSGIGWKARIHQGQVLEAVAYPDGLGKEGVHIEMGGQPEAELPSLEGVQVPTSLLVDGRVTPAALAVSAGTAKGLLSQSGGNFVTATGITSVSVATARSQASSVVAPTDTARRVSLAQGAPSSPPPIAPPIRSGAGSGSRFDVLSKNSVDAAVRAEAPLVAEQAVPQEIDLRQNEPFDNLFDSQRTSGPAMRSRMAASEVDNERMGESAGRVLDYSSSEYSEDHAALYKNEVSPFLKIFVGVLALVGVLLLLVLLIR